MSDEAVARYTGGSQSGVDVTIQYKDGDVVNVHVPHGGTLPGKTQDGRTVPNELVKSLLEQEDNWAPPGKTPAGTSSSAGGKEGVSHHG